MAKLKVVIVGDASSAKKAFAEVGGGASSLAGKVGGALGGIAKAGAIAAGAAGIGAIAVSLKSGYDEWKQSATVSAQTGAVLKSTGHSANVTAKQVDDLAGALLRKSGVDDEVIKSGENMLLTFTNIRNEAGKGNDVFTQSTQTLLDMSVATGQDMPKAAVLLGKALNDPIKGVSALTRVGVTFTDGQKKSIKAMMDAGDTMGAQKVILKELNKEFGGSAEALGKTLPGQINIAKQQFANLAGEMFQKLLPVFVQVLGWVNTHWPEISRVMGAVFSAIAWSIQNVLVPALRIIVRGVTWVVNWVRAHWTQIVSYTKTAFENIKAVVMFYVGIVEAIWRHFGSQILTVIRATWEYVKSTVRNALEIVRGIINVIGGIIHGDWARIWHGIQQIVGGTLKQIWNTIKTYVAILGAVASAAGHAIWEGLKSGATGVINWIIDKLNAIISAFNAIPFVHNIPTIGHVGGAGGGNAGGPTGMGGPVGAPGASASGGAIRRPGSEGESVQVTVGPVHGSADAAFAQRLAAELATQLRGGRTPALQQAIAAV